MTHNQLSEGEINAIVVQNVKNYIETIDKSQQWVYERSNMSKTEFDNLLNGQGDLKKSIQRLNKLFRIKDPFYFYNEHIQLPSTLAELEADSIRNLSPTLFNGKDNKEFKETMIILNDVMNMIHTLKSAKELG